MEALNRFATDYAGFLAIAGFILTVVTGIAAVYFYYNPRKSSYRVSYKLFAPAFFGRRFRFHSEPGDDTPKAVSHYVDFWNSGSESVSQEVIREQISVALQSSSRSLGTELTGASVVHETHPGMSNFSILVEGESAVLRWDHFDPGMGVRIQIILSSKETSDQIAVFGQGLRLNLKRVRQLSEIGGIADGARKVVVVGIPLAVSVALGGPAVTWFASQSVSGLISYLAFAGLAIAVALLAAGCGMLGWGVNSLIDRVFNTRSPTQVLIDDPDVYGGNITRVSGDRSFEDEHVNFLREELRFAERMAERRQLLSAADDETA